MLGGLAHAFKLLPDALCDPSEPFGCLAISLARNTVQLCHYSLLLCALPLSIGARPLRLRALALYLSALTFRLLAFIAAGHIDMATCCPKSSGVARWWWMTVKMPPRLSRAYWRVWGAPLRW